MATAPKTRPAKPPVPLGTDTALKLRGRAGAALPLTYWDLWFVLAAEMAYDGDLDILAEHLRGERTGYRREDAIRKLGHLRELQMRLGGAGTTIAMVLNAAGPALLDTEKLRAMGRVINHNERPHERSDMMLYPIKKDLYANALRGRWPSFPVSPELYAGRLARRFSWGKFHGENASHGLARKLDRETECAQKLADKDAMAEALAMLRSLLTVALELIEISDDSFGAIGESFGAAFTQYLDFPRQQTGIQADVFLSDLLEFLVWENYGFTANHTDGYFSRLTGTEADFCLEYLRPRIIFLQAIDLDYESEKALTLTGQIAAERKRFDLFEPLAREMAAREWKRIIILADAAEKTGKHDLALKVFNSALTDGEHIDFLSSKCEQLRCGKWDPDPQK